MSKIKVVHYINQFFAQIGGEEKADYPAELRVGEIVGPGQALTQQFGEEAEIVATIVCGDSYFNENLDKAKADILEMVKSQNPDIFIAGPAFNAGRYGVACGTICDAVQEELGIPAVTGMYVENPGADMFKNKVYTVSTKNSAAGMRDAVKKLAPLALKIAKGEKIGASCQEGYMPNGVRVNFFEKERGSKRAVKMLLKKLADKPFETEYPMPSFHSRLSKTLARLQSHFALQVESFRKEIRTTSKVQMLLTTENMTSQALWILQKKHTKQLMVDMTRYTLTKMQTVYFL